MGTWDTTTIKNDTSMTIYQDFFEQYNQGDEANIAAINEVHDLDVWKNLSAENKTSTHRKNGFIIF